MATNNNDWQRMTTSDNEWYNEWQRIRTSDNEWPLRLIFLFFQIREEPTTKHPKENSLNLKSTFEESLLNEEQKQAPKKKY